MKEIKSKTASALTRLKSIWHPNLILLAVVAGGVVTLITYPGIWYSDSISRAGMAWQMAQMPWNEIPPEEINPYLSLLPQFVIAFCLEITRNYAFYTWVQASFFLWSILSFVHHFFDGAWRVFAGVLFLISPLILGYSVFWEMGVVAAACLLWMLIIEDVLNVPGSPQPRRLRGVLWLLYGAAAFFMVGYRPNAGTAVVGLALWGAAHAWRRSKSLRGWLPGLLAAGLGVFLVLGLPGRFGLKGRSNAVVGFAWESACMLSEIGEGQGFDTCLDPVFGEGATRRIMAIPREKGQTSLYAYGEAGVDFLWATSPEGNKTVYQCFSQLVRSHPGLYIKLKGNMIRNSLRTLVFGEYNYNRWDVMADYNFSDTLRRQQFHRLVTDYMEVNEWLRTPWLLFALSAVLGVLQYAVCGGTVPLKLLWTAFCYEGAFFITTQGFEFRYFFPACLLLLFTVLLSLQALLPAAWRRLRAKRRGREAGAA